MDPLLAGIGLSRRGEGGAPIFRPLDIEIGAGERVALVGPSGSGKTLALRLLALLDSPDAGEVRWRGAPIESEEVPRHRRRVHLLAQGAAMAPGTGMDNLELAFSVGVAGSRFPRDRAAGLLEELGAGAIAERDVAELSGGERQLIALCRALLVEPQILLLDEATSALDPDRTARAERAVEAWLEGRGRAALWVSHDAAQRDRVADRIVEVHRG